MNVEIRVHVVHYAECKNLILRYKDPLTGKYVRKSSGTASRKDARKRAGIWQSELNSGKARGRYAVTWEQFTQRYEEEVLPSLAPMTAKKAMGVFSVLESILPQVKNGLLRELTAERLERVAGRATQTWADGSDNLRPPGPPTRCPGVGRRSRATCRPSEDEAAQACQAKRWGRSDEGQADHRRRVRADAQ